MRVQFASDLHLNSWSQQQKDSKKKEPGFEKILEPVAKTLVLAGDIGYPDSPLLQTFLKWCSKRWDTIFWIPGHHEFSDVWHLRTKTFDQCLQHIRLIASPYPNIHVLMQDSFITEDGFLFLGCPLWARLTSMSEEMSADPIYRDITKHYEQDLQWLRAQVRNTRLPIVIATHYPPTYTLFTKQLLNKPESVPYALETETLLRPPVVAWICGYLHQSVQVRRPYMDAEGKKGDVLIVSNARGYPDDTDTFYRPEAVLRLTNSV